MSAQNIAAISALTPLQEGILFHVLKQPDRQVYHSQFCATIDGPLDAGRWREAWQNVVARHATLRTLFTWEGREKPLQIVRHQVEIPWQVLDWTEVDAADESRRIEALLQRDRDLGFDLARAPLLRLILIRLGDRRHRFVFSFHHLILDGWSMRLVLNDAQRIYRALGRGADPGHGEAPSFTRYVEWLDGREDGDGAFWRARLGDFSQPVFPSVAASEPVSNATHNVCERVLDDALGQRLTDLARSTRVTMSSLVSAAWGLLLSRYAGRNDVVFGTTVAGRPPELDGAENTAGLFINTLPLRVAVDETVSAAAFLADVHARQVALRGVEHTPLVSAQRASAVEPGEPLFETIVVYENFPAQPAGATLPDVSLTLDTFVEYSHYPLALLAVPDDPMRLLVVSDPARLDSAAASDLLENVVAMLAAIAGDPDAPLARIPTLAPAQRERVTLEFNQTDVDAGEAIALWRQFEEQAGRTPDAVAVAGDDGSLSYAELARQARSIAARLQRSGVSPGDPVIITAPRDTRVIAGVLGIMAAGGVYVPVSPGAPPARLAMIASDLDDAFDNVWILSPSSMSAGALPGARQVALDVAPGDAGDEAQSCRDVTLDMDAPAYVMYTSGSTGTPKGVAVSQRNLFHSVDARDRYYGEGPASFLLMSDLSTDSSIAGLFWTLGRGGKLLITGDRAEQDMAALVHSLEAHAVTHLLTVPSLYGMMLEHLDATKARSLRVAIVAGEACPQGLSERHAQTLPQAALHNEYGPTEATVWCSAARLRAGKPVTIGRPVANTRLYVLDDDNRPLPIGVAGELCVAGAQVAKGYVGDPERDAQRFVTSPFVRGERMYRTGDRVRWRRDGELEFVGRVDQQIKVRGYRVEPGEIETCIARYPGVADVAVVLNDGRLVAFLATTAALDAQALREHLVGELPGHMVPQRIEVLDALPRTAADKIDRQRLRGLSLQARASATPRDEPVDETQRMLADIWRDVLGIDGVGVHDDFFALGGDSLLSIRVLARAGKAGLSISPADFFAYPTIAGQAARASTGARRRPSQSPAVGPLPLLPIQRWFFKHIDRSPQHWNLSYLFELAHTPGLENLQRAVGVLIATHDALRSGFERVDNEWRAQLVPPTEFPVVSELDLRSLAPEDVDAAVTGQADRLNASFDLSHPPLFRVCLVRTPGNRPDQLLIVAHHLVIDAESWRILLEDLALALRQLADGQAPGLPEKTDSIRTWANRLAGMNETPELADAAAAWASALRDPVADLESAAPLVGEAVSEARARDLVVALDGNETRALLDAVDPSRSSVREMLLAAVARALGRHQACGSVRIEMEGHGREALFDDVDISRTVGWMTSAFPVTVRAEPRWADHAAILRAAKSALRELPHNGLSYGLIADGDLDSTDARSVRNAGRRAVLLNYLGQRSASPAFGDLRLLSERCGAARSPDAPRAYLLEINALIEDARLTLCLRWPADAFEEQAIRRLAGEILDSLRALSDTSGDTAVPEDFPLASLDQQELSDLSALLDDLDD